MPASTATPSTDPRILGFIWRRSIAAGETDCRSLALHPVCGDIPSVAVATYPGTVSPLRGLDPFGEAERDVLFGRDRARDDLAKLVGGDGFRAGLLHGEPGIGKTSLLKAGLLPQLRDHG